MDENTRYTQGQASLNVWSAQYPGLRRRQHRTEHKGHTPNPRIRTWAAGLEGRDSTDHATATDEASIQHFKSYSFLSLQKLQRGK